MSLVVVIMGGIGILLIYSAVKGENPADVIKRAMK